jgi:hypothetical protein
MWNSPVRVGDSILFEGRLREVTAIFGPMPDGSWRFRLEDWSIVPCTECSLPEENNAE